MGDFLQNSWLALLLTAAAAYLLGSINSAIIGDLLTTIGSRVAEDKALFTSEGYSLTENTDWER